VILMTAHVNTPKDTPSKTESFWKNFDGIFRLCVDESSKSEQLLA
jgi:hypothetical protein